MTSTDIPAIDEAGLEAFVGRAVVDMGAAISGLLHIGDRLGLYKAMAGAGPLAQEVGLGLGAQAGERQLAIVLREAGFTHVCRATETPFNIILEARP
jgi:hypothetical protein